MIMFDGLYAIAKNIIFFVGLTFSILLMGKRSKAIREAAFGPRIVNHEYGTH